MTRALLVFGLSCAFLVASAFPAPPPVVPEPKAGDLQMTLDVVAALEHGPVVVVMGLKNSADNDVQFSYRPREDRSIGIPQSWPGKLYIYYHVGPVNTGTARVESLGAGKAERYTYVAHQIADPVAGEYPVAARWVIRRVLGAKPDRLPPVIVELKANSTLTVEKRTDASVAALVRSLNQRLDKSDRPEDNAIVRDCLEGVDLPALEPVARRLVGRDRESRERAILWMFRYLPSDRVTSVALDQLTGQKATGPYDWLDAWRMYARKHPPTDEHLRRLREAPDVWTRLAALACFPHAFTEAQAGATLKEAESFRGPVTVAQLKPLVEQLDDAAFKKREEAAARISQYRERSLPALRQLSAGIRSAEVQGRLGAIIAAIERQPPDEAETWFVDALPSCSAHTPYARRILEALAKNAPEARVTTQARRVLSEYDARQASEKK